MEKRLFIGVKINASEELLNLLSILKQELSSSDIKWVDTQNMHLTLKFLGMVKPESIEGILLKLEDLSNQFSSFCSRVINIGKFENNRQTKIIWCGISDDGQLLAMAKKISTTMFQIGFEIEKIPYIPHLTLGRARTICDEENLTTLINMYHNRTLQILKISEIILFESVLIQSDHIYKIIDRFQLNQTK